MSELYACSRCGVVSKVEKHLCNPLLLSGRQDYCGRAPKAGAMCDTMQEQLPFVCGTCRRPAEQAELVCDPLVTG